MKDRISMGKLLHLLPPLLLLFLLALPPEREKAEAPEPSPEPLPIVQTIPPTPTPEPEPVVDKPAPHPVGPCTITYYDPCVLCCGKTDAITASGTKAIPYETCAVDPSVIPLGSTVLVDFGDGVIRQYRAEDTGGSIDGSHLDICVESHMKALELGVKQAAVWWTEGEQP